MFSATTFSVLFRTGKMNSIFICNTYICIISAANYHYTINNTQANNCTCNFMSILQNNTVVYNCKSCCKAAMAKGRLFMSDISPQMPSQAN